MNSVLVLVTRNMYRRGVYEYVEGGLRVCYMRGSCYFVPRVSEERVDCG
jgi:hypothetical protein